MCDECEKLKRALKITQAAAKRLEASLLNRITEARQQGYKEAGVDWKNAVEYGKRQEQLRLDENHMFTLEIMKLEEEIRMLKDKI